MPFNPLHLLPHEKSHEDEPPSPKNDTSLFFYLPILLLIFSALALLFLNQTRLL